MTEVLTKQASDNPASYDSYLVAFHEAFRPELEAAVARYPTSAKTRVLDIPCGDGFYTALFARQMRGGELVAGDLSQDYLDRAARRVKAERPRANIRFEKLDAYHLPFDDESFDLVWCAQSLISLANPTAALSEMRRVLRPRGVAAVMETDEYHHILLPWPVSLELAIHKAIRVASRRRYGSGTKLAQARKLRSTFLAAALKPMRKGTITANREAPFDHATRTFLIEHFAYLRRLIGRDLAAEDLTRFDRFTAADGDESFLVSPESELTCLAMIGNARR